MVHPNSNNCLNYILLFGIISYMKDTRLKLLKTSARIFARKGYSGTSVRDIVNAAHVNVSAITYYFGGKRELFFETIRFLIEDHRKHLWGKEKSIPTLRQIENYSYKQALELLHHMVNKLLDNGLSCKNLPLERIFTQVELESAGMRKMLLEYMTPFHELPFKLLSLLTGLPEKSPELLCVAHNIFGQIMLSETQRLAIEHNLGISRNYSPALRETIKKTAWAHMLGILNLYKEGSKLK